MYTLLYFTLILWYNIHTDLTRRTQCDNLQSDIKMRPALFLKEEMLDTLDCYCDDQIERYKKLQEQLENLRKG